MFSKQNIVLGLLALAGVAVGVYAVMQISKLKKLTTNASEWAAAYPESK
jgi:hypothetical protein